MNTAQNSAKMSREVIFLCLLMTSITFFGCEDPGVVGGGFTDTNTNIQVDTMEVNILESHSFNYYSGRLTFFSAGQFNDPVFGDMLAIGLMRPALSSSDDDSIGENATVSLRLQIDQGNIYGDSAQTAEFDLVEIDQIWRGKAWELENEVQLSGNPPVGSFTVGTEDSVEVVLSDSWVDKYRPYFESDDANVDSLYRIEFPGLAVVPQNSSKIIPIEAQASRLKIRNSDEDSLEVGLGDWAYSLQRSNQTAPPAGTSEFHSTLEQVFSFDVGLTEEDLGTVNISKVELVLYEDADLLTSSMNQISTTAGRPEISNALIHLVEPEHVPVVLDPGSPLLAGVHNEDDGTIRFNLTNFVNSILLDGISPELEFYLTLQTNNGVIRSTLIHNNQAPEALQPKLIVTSVQTQEGTN